jgi:hypothetical protein
VTTASTTVVVADGVEKELGWVLHDERCIRSMPRHKKKDGGAMT